MLYIFHTCYKALKHHYTLRCFRVALVQNKRNTGISCAFKLLTTRVTLNQRQKAMTVSKRNIPTRTQITHTRTHTDRGMEGGKEKVIEKKKEKSDL